MTGSGAVEPVVGGMVGARPAFEDVQASGVSQHQTSGILGRVRLFAVPWLFAVAGLLFQGEPGAPGFSVVLPAGDGDQVFHGLLAPIALRPDRVLGPAWIASDLDTGRSREVVLVDPARFPLQLVEALIQEVGQVLG